MIFVTVTTINWQGKVSTFQHINIKKMLKLRIIEKKNLNAPYPKIFIKTIRAFKIILS